MRFTAIGLLILAKYTLQQNFTLVQPATGPSLTCQGDNLILQCVIDRNGVAVDPDWRRNGTLVDTNVLTGHQIKFNSTYNANTDLVITNVGPEDDNTEYECTVQNSNITSSIVLNVTGPPSIEDLNVGTSECSVLVMWSTNSDEICGVITYNVTFNNGSSMFVNQSPTNLNNLVPDTDYTLAIFAMNRAGRGMALTRVFKTAIPKEMFTASWECDDNTCIIFVKWTTTTETNERCSSILNLGIEGVSAFTDTVNVTNGANTTSYTSLISVNKLITTAVLIATYHGGETRRSGPINPITGYSYLLHSLEGKIKFNNKNISITATWRGATNLGITYRVSVTCNNNYTNQTMVEDVLTTSLIILENATADNIRCELNVSSGDILESINISLNESRLSTSTDNDYCEDNPGVCIGVPVAVSLATVIVLVAGMLLFVYPTTRNMILTLFHQTSKAKVFSETNATDNEYVTVTEETNTNDQPSSDSDAISLENTDLVEAVANERTKYAEVILPDNPPIHLPPNNLVSYAEIQH